MTYPESHSLYSIFSEAASTGVAFKNKSLKRAIINLLDGFDSATVNDISKELNISVPKAASLINELMQENLIRDYGKIDSKGGRKASIYGLVSGACFFVGVDVKKFYVNIGLLDFKKHLVTVKENVPFTLANTPESLQALLSIIKDFICDFPELQSKILGVGINMSGRINHLTGYSYSFFHFQEEPLSSIIEKEIGIPTFIENDSRSMAYGEFMAGVVKFERNVLFINVDYGIGMGILIDGNLYYGKSGFSGELGHIPFFNNEIICHCGKKGCLETETSGIALLNTVKEKIRQGTSSILMNKQKKVDDLQLQDIIDAALKEDMLVIETLADMGEKLGKALAVLINIFNPELVILGGLVSETGDFLRLPVKSALNKYSLGLVNTDTKLKASKLGSRAGVMGGCLIARGMVLKDN
ncbi:MAG: ROK family transcriptional regulator [Sphingobacteriales bacterium]|jgi:predicted NBD/HSP70 family sugar kinase